jgi:hypothetical protein
MANSKISALTAATTPLAGTEVLPVVQSGVTTQVSVDNLTAGKTVPTGKIQASSTGEIVKLTTSGTVTTGGTDYIRFYDSGGAKGYVGYAGTSAELTINSGAGCYLSLNSVNSNMTLKVGNTTRVDIDTVGNTTLSTGNLIQGTAAKGINFTANTPAAGMTSQLLNWYEEGTWTPAQGSGLTVVGSFSSAGRYVRIGKQVTVTGSVSGSTSIALAGGAAILTNNIPYSPGTVPGVGLAINSGATASSTFQASVTTLYNVTAIAATAAIYFSVTYNLN